MEMLFAPKELATESLRKQLTYKEAEKFRLSRDRAVAWGAIVGVLAAETAREIVGGPNIEGSLAVGAIIAIKLVSDEAKAMIKINKDINGKSKAGVNETFLGYKAYNDPYIQKILTQTDDI